VVQEGRVFVKMLFSVIGRMILSIILSIVLLIYEILMGFCNKFNKILDKWSDFWEGKLFNSNDEEILKELEEGDLEGHRYRDREGNL
jgi:hypothetical protein